MQQMRPDLFSKSGGFPEHGVSKIWAQRAFGEDIDAYPNDAYPNKVLQILLDRDQVQQAPACLELD
jgi:hypothetical protein